MVRCCLYKRKKERRVLDDACRSGLSFGLSNAFFKKKKTYKYYFPNPLLISLYRTVDYLKFTGIAIDGGMIHPLPWYKTYNRPYLLQHVLEQNMLVTNTTTTGNHNGNITSSTLSSSSDAGYTSPPTTTTEPEYKVYYDIVLMMDSAQIIANMDYDPSRLLPLVSLSSSSSSEGTMNNNGYTNNNNGAGGGLANFNSTFLVAWGNIVPSTSTTSNNGRPMIELRDYSTLSNIKISNVMVWNMNHPNIRKVAR